MTSASLARQQRHVPDEWDVRRQERETEDAPPACGVPIGIGQVEEGSLEETMWRELGALPASRREKRGAFTKNRK